MMNRSAFNVASMSCPSPEMRNPSAMSSSCLPSLFASSGCSKPRRCAAEMQTTKSMLCFLESSVQQCVKFNSSSGGMMVLKA